MDGHRSKSRWDSVCINGSSIRSNPKKRLSWLVIVIRHSGAQQNGLDSIGVLYGFGEETELQEAGV